MLSAKFEYGTEVRVITNIRNDGSFPGCKKGEVLVRRGAVGYVRQAGFYLQDQIVYQIQFLDRGLTVGCKETELQEATQLWHNNRFEYGDKASLAVSLASKGEILITKGTVVDVLAVHRDEEEIPSYRIQHGEHDLEVPERALNELQEVAYVG